MSNKEDNKTTDFPCFAVIGNVPNIDLLRMMGVKFPTINVSDKVHSLDPHGDMKKAFSDLLESLPDFLKTDGSRGFQTPIRVLHIRQRDMLEMHSRFDHDGREYLPSERPYLVKTKPVGESNKPVKHNPRPSRFGFLEGLKTHKRR